MSKKSQKDPIQVRGSRRDALKVAGVLLAVVATLFYAAGDSLTLGSIAYILISALICFLMAMWNWSTMDYRYAKKDTSPKTIKRERDEVELACTDQEESKP